MKRMIQEAPKPTKRVRRLRELLHKDTDLAQLVSAVRMLVKEWKPETHRLRAAVDIVVQEMRERKYRKELTGTTQCGGSSSPEASS